VGSTLAPRLLRRFRPAVVIGTGLLMGAAGLALLAQVGPSDLQLVVVASVVISLGLAPVFTATTDLIVGSAPPERAGAASGISETGAELGGALGIAILGSVGTAIYRAELADRLPSSIAVETLAVARDTLGAAVAVARRLPVRLGDALVATARDAFIHGMRVTAVIAMVAALVVAAVAVTYLRHVPSGDGREAAGASDGTAADGDEAVETATGAVNAE
jgi:MFS transporter, DHA2 family, multidrug resistance protein